MEKRVLIWDDGLNYVNYMEALRAVDLTPVVGRCAAASRRWGYRGSAAGG